MRAHKLVGIGAFAAAAAIIGAFEAFGLTLNTTTSYPRGLWRQTGAAIPPLQRDRMVLACPPRSAPYDLAASRGYMGRSGRCSNSYRPVMKRVVAVAGDAVTFDGPGGAMRVNGRAVPNSAHQPVDGAGRPMLAWPGGVIPAHHALLLSDYDPYSFDGRYTGPIPDGSIYAYAAPVLTLP